MIGQKITKLLQFKIIKTPPGRGFLVFGGAFSSELQYYDYYTLF